MDGRTRLYNLLIGNTSGPQYSLPYDAIGRDFGTSPSQNNDDNFFERRRKSIDNAVGTTGAALAATGGNLIGAGIASLTGDGNYQSHIDKKHSDEMKDILDNADRSERDILKKYGYNNRDEYYDALDALESAGDTEKYNNLVNTVGAEIKNLYSGTANKQSEKASEYDDFVENNPISQRINQDPGKFAGSAINTLSTAFDVMAPGAGVLANSVQGGIEGIADELEQNGLQNFDWGRAGQNAFTGATVGAVTGGLNKGLNSALAKNGGNLFKGSNKLTQGLNNLGSKTAVGRVGSTLATGAARGAVSGAVGGATGAGLSAAMNGQDVLGSAIQGARQGFGQGALAGGIMAGANMAANATPGVRNIMQGINEANENWKNSGDTFSERLKNTWDSGDSAVANAVENIGEGVRNIAGNMRNGELQGYVKAPNTPNADDLINLRDANNPGATGDIASNSETEVYRKVSSDTSKQSTGWDDLAKEYGYKDYDEAIQKFVEANPGVEANAGNITDWMDQTLNADKKAFSQAKSSNRIKNERAIVEEIIDQFNTPDKPTIRGTKPNETFYNLYDKMGLSDGNEIRQAVHFAEPGELVPTIIREAAGKAGVIDIDDARALVTKLNLKRQNYNKLVNVMEDIMDSTPSTIAGGKNGVDALQLQRAIESMASDAMGTSGEYHIGNNVVDQTTARNLLRISSSIGDSLDNAAAANNAVKYALNKYAPEIEQMRSTLPKNSKWQSYIDNEISGATSIKQLRNSIRDLTRASIFINNGDENYASAGSRYSRQTNIPTTKSGVTNKLVNAVVDKISETPLARKIRLDRAQKGINKEAKIDLNNQTAMDTNAQNAPIPTAPIAGVGEESAQTTYNPATRVYNAIGRTEGLTNAEQAKTADYLTNAVQQTQGNTLESLMSPSTSTSSTGVYNSMYGGGQTSGASAAGVQSYFPTTGDYWTDILGIAMTGAIDDGDYTAFGALYEMYKDAASNASKNSSSGTSNQKITSTQQRANAAMTALDEVSRMEPDLGYNLSGIPLVGNIATFGGNAYEGAARNLAQQIGYMVSGANIKEEEAVNIGKSYVPQPFDSEEERQRKLRRAYDIIRQYQNGYAADDNTNLA